jgi:toxin ParE1/3/4
LKVVVSPQAKQDLEEIFDYILEENPVMAQVVLDRLRVAIVRLAEMPQMGRAGRVAGTRELVIPKTPFLIPYQVTGRTLEILRVYHGARQWPDSF